MIVEMNSAARDPAPQLPMDESRPLPVFGMVMFAIALAGVVIGLALWSGIPDYINRAKTDTNVSVAMPSGRSAVPAVQARPDISAATADCALAAPKNPFADYFSAPPTSPTNNLSGEGWYSVMSLKAKLERRGSGC
jgi:hypothetical protein